MRKDGLKDLDLYPTSELIDEVLQRSHMAVFHGRYYVDGQPDKMDEVWNYYGDPLFCSGLAISLAHKIAKDFVREEDDEGRTTP